VHGPLNGKLYSCCFINMFNSKNSSCLRQEVNCNLILRASLTFTTQRVTELKKNMGIFKPCIRRIYVSKLGRSLARVTRGLVFPRSVLPGKCRNIALSKPRPLPSRSFQSKVHKSSKVRHHAV